MRGTVLRGQALVEFDANPTFIQFVCERAGLNAVEGIAQSWEVGGRSLLVEWKLDRARYIFVLWVRHGWPLRPARRSPLCLAEVYAITLTNTVRAFNGPEQGWFKVKALLDSGIVPRPDVALAELPLDAPESARETWKLIREVQEVRVAQGRESQPTPLSAPWLASWNETDQSTVRAGKRFLEKHHLIVHVADQAGPAPFGRPLKLWSIKTDKS